MIGRTTECDALQDVLARARDGLSAALVLRGEAGIGKTSLLEYVIGSARDFHVLRVTGIESEIELGFAALHQLVRPLLPGISRLPDPQRKALESVFGLAEEPAPTRFLAGQAILTLLSDAVTGAGEEQGRGEQGILCAIDDGQWLDQASAEVLAFVARRLQADRIAFVIAVRDAPGNHVQFEGLDSLRVRALTPADAHQLLAGLVASPVSARVSSEIARRTGGNPLALAEAAGELTAEQLAGTAVLPHPLPVGTDVQDRYWHKVAALPSDERQLLLVAAAEPSGDPDLFGRAAENLGLSPGLVDAAPIRELLAVTDRVTFRHPLIRSAVYAGSPRAARQRAHAAIAAATDPGRDQGQIAWHRAAAAQGPDEEIAAGLERAAGRAARRGGHAASAALLRRAADLTPDDGRRGERLLTAADAEFMAGRASQATALLDQAVPRLRDDRLRARALQLQGTIQFDLGDGNRAPDTLCRAAKALAPHAPLAARDTLVDGVFAEVYSGGRAWLDALPVVRAAGPAGDPGQPAIADLMLDGYAALSGGDPAAAAQLLRRVVEAVAADNLPPEEGLRWYGRAILCATDVLDLGAWRLLADRMIALCRAWGALTTLPHALDYLGVQQGFAGHLSAAEAGSAEGRDIVAATEAKERMGVRAAELLVAAWRGQEATLRTAAASMASSSARQGQGRGVLYPSIALTIFGLGARDYQAALAHARVLLDDNGPHGGSVILPYAVEAAVHCEDLQTAELAMSRLGARAAGSPSDSVLGLYAQCRALVLDVSDAEREALFAEAITLLQRCQAPAEVARTRLLYGEWLRRKRQRRRARDQLFAARDAFTAIGARAFAERAALALAADGAAEPGVTADTRTAGHQLTEREAQIAEIVATGATNRQVAGQLFISASTVDYHLRHIYRKLGVSSRTMLAAYLRD